MYPNLLILFNNYLASGGIKEDGIVNPFSVKYLMAPTCKGTGISDKAASSLTCDETDDVTDPHSSRFDNIVHLLVSQISFS
jgi:hypothetical protein